MWVPIGRRPASPPDDALLELLLECHGRIRRFLATGRRLVEAEGAPAAEVTETAQALYRYFATALPLHVLDEEATIMPRVRGRYAHVDVALDRMAAEHASHGPNLARLIDLCAELGQQPEQLPARRAALNAVITALEGDLLPHLTQEEAVIFPVLGLSADGMLRISIENDALSLSTP